MSEANSKSIWIVTEEAETTAVEGDKSRGLSNPWQTERVVVTETVVQVSSEKLEANMTEFLEVVAGIFERADAQAEKKSRMQLDEVELSVEISGEGEVKLLGTGGKAGAKGAITLKFKRNQTE
ncbi:MAG: hypothetical protein ACFB4I_23395 [Cyanophyceae cyanobacterium]